MKKILFMTLLALGLSTSAIAADPAKKSNDYNFAIGIAEDYGLGLTMQFKKRIDVSIGHAGVGADFIFFRYNFMPKSKFFSKRPLNFYVAGGGGYIWEDSFSGMRKGAIARTPIGADWQFARKWSVYLSYSPAINFQKAYDNVDRDTKFVSMGTLGISLLF